MNLRYIGLVSLVAGAVWGCIWQVCRYFRFTPHSPGLLLQPWHELSWLSGAVGAILGVAAFIGFSLLAGFVYAWAFSARVSLIRPILFGLTLWFLCSLADEQLRWWSETFAPNPNTLVTDACLFVQWALFIGQSISYRRNGFDARIGEN